MRILFVAMPDSVHAARWTNQLVGSEWDIHLFPTYFAEPHPDFKDITIHDTIITRRPDGMSGDVRLRGVWPFGLRKGAYVLAREMERRFLKAARARRLAAVIRRYKPDIMHSLEIQHSAYLTMTAREYLRGVPPPWIVTNWGSDIYLFGRIPDHANKIRAVLAASDYYSCECERDVKLARDFGFTGEVLPVLPNTGGFEVERVRQFRQPGPASARKSILLKGYQGWAGRALVGLRAIEMAADLLQDYQVLVYLASPEVELKAELVSEATGIPIRVVPKCSHDDMLRLHGRARISIGLSISDAISTSFLEALVMGSFPIQSNTSCANEWIEHGRTGLLVPPEDPDVVAEAIRRAVSDDELVNTAVEANDRLIVARLGKQPIQEKVIAMYDSIAARGRNKRR